jgi:glycosyltransferase involved in cell wall biosynthesis
MTDLDSEVGKVILYIHHGRGLGGAPLSLLYLIQALDQYHYKPIVCCLHQSDVVPLYRQNDVETIVVDGIDDFPHSSMGWFPLTDPRGLVSLCLKLIHFVPSVYRSWRLIGRVKADLVHLNGQPLLPCALGAKMAGVPVIWHIREPVAEGHLGLRKNLVRWWVHTLADEVIYICQDNKDRLSVRNKGTVVYNFVDFRQFDRSLTGQKMREELGLRPEDRVVLFTGGLNPRKGTLELVKAVHRLQDKMPDLHCVIAGQRFELEQLKRRLSSRLACLIGVRPYSEAVLEYVAQNDLETVVIFPGFLYDVAELFAASDLVVVPWTVPHFARPVIEAGAMAKPVVASRIGGVEEVVRNGKSGLLVPPGDVAALALALARVLTDSTLAMSLGEDGYQQARHLFDAETNARQTMEVYERVLGR